MSDHSILTVVDEGLGNTAYLVDLGDGRALAVDPSRDQRAMHDALSAHGLKVAFAADTHLHADFLTGVLQLADTDRARVLASAAGGREFEHTGLRDGDEVDLGGLTLHAWGTPGHTDEHLSYVLADGARTLGVFTGGSLLVGAVARTDLVDPARTEELARAQYRSIQRLLSLPDDVAVWPTHGAGSFCAAASGAERTSTIGAERATNGLLAATDEDAFVTQLVAGFGSYPPYFDRLGEINRRGPGLLPRDLPLDAMDARAVAAVQATGATIVDVRPFATFADGHAPGALSIPLRPAFVSWLGWLVDNEVPIVVVRDLAQDPEELLWQAAKIGYENVLGELAGGMATWTAAGLPTGSVPVMDAAGEPDSRILDIRQDAEYRAGHVPGAVHVELGSLASAVDELADDVPTVVMCGHGERASTAASLLAAHGLTHVSILAGGPEDWAESAGQPLETGA
jgi:hydroxyacylglutathione hydrolase